MTSSRRAGRRWLVRRRGSAGPLRLYRNASTRNPRSPVALVMGPWVHGAWHGDESDHLGPVQFVSRPRSFLKTQSKRRSLKNGSKTARTASARGLDVRNRRQPLASIRRLAAGGRASPDSLSALGGTLAFDPPPEPAAFDQYVSDPAAPVPFTSFITLGMAQEYMVDDQRFAARRPDVLVYQTPPLDSDLPSPDPSACASTPPPPARTPTGS